MLLPNISVIFLLIFIFPQYMQADDKLRPYIESKKQTSQDQTILVATTPSPEWLEYQRERFSNTKDVENLRKMLDPASQLLKNQREQIINPNPLRVEQHSQKQTSITTEKAIENAHKDGETIHSDDGAEDNDDDDDDDGDDSDDEMRSKEGNTNILTYAIKGIQFPTMRGFIGFLKGFKRNWIKHSTMTIEQKVNDLKRLKTKLMYLIEDRFNMIWKPKEYMRHKRGLLDESNLNFPPEAALMTINFLTFAVFLIKLVLQVVHVIKSKHYKLSGFGLTDTDAMTKVT